MHQLFQEILKQWFHNPLVQSSSMAAKLMKQRLEKASSSLQSRITWTD